MGKKKKKHPFIVVKEPGYDSVKVSVFKRVILPRLIDDYDPYEPEEFFMGFQLNKKRKVIKTPYTDPNEALDWAEGKVRQMIKDTILKPGSFEELKELIISDYQLKKQKSLGRMERALGNMERHFDGKVANEITRPEIKKYIRRRTLNVSDKLWSIQSKKPAAAGTIRYELAILRKVLNLAVDEGKLSKAPSFKDIIPDEAPPKQGFIEWPELRLLMQHCPEYLRAPIRFGALTGWRIDTIRAMRWSWVNLQKKVILVPAGTQKNKKPLMLPFGSAPEVDEIFQEQWDKLKVVPATPKQRKQTPVFPGDDGKEPFGDFRSAWNRACRESGLGYGYKQAAKYAEKYSDLEPGPTFHDLRRSAVRSLIRSGVKEKVAMRITGHKTRQVFDRYNITDEDDIMDALSAAGKYSNKGLDDGQDQEERQTG